MRKSKRPTMPCATCGKPIPVPLLETERPRCFPCINREISEASADQN